MHKCVLKKQINALKKKVRCDVSWNVTFDDSSAFGKKYKRNKIYFHIDLGGGNKTFSM